MKYLPFLLCIFMLSCTSKHVTQNWTDKTLPPPPQMANVSGQRSLASDEEYLGRAYSSYFGDQNYVGRLEKVRKLVGELHSLMEIKGHPRKQILKKFQTDLDQQIKLLGSLESADQNGLTLSWLPKEGTYQYGAKIRALRAVKESSDTMALLEAYIFSLKVLEDTNNPYALNFYYNLMRKGLAALGDDLQKLGLEKSQDSIPAKVSYGGYLASVARANLHKVFPERSDRPLQNRINLTLRKLQQVRTAVEAQSMAASPEVKYATSILMNADYFGSSDIEGSRDDMETKLSTYFNLEMIKYLYGRMN